MGMVIIDFIIKNIFFFFIISVLIYLWIIFIRESIFKKCATKVKKLNPQSSRYSNTKPRVDYVTGKVVIIEDLNGNFIRVEDIDEFMLNNKDYEFNKNPNINNISSKEINTSKNQSVQHNHNIINKTLKDIKISETERLQKMLDIYWNGKWKDNKEIGKIYERYIGFLWEENGFKVEYHGINLGLKDEGIDLICKKGNLIELIQCKYWGKEKTIYEKHIKHLNGSTNYYKNQNDKNNEISLIEGEKKIFLHPVFITSTQLSEVAKDVARSLKVEIIEGKLLDRTYPSIKCNVSNNGNKIYHLPFDGLYDRTKVNKKGKGECYVRTVEEAERLGFRHTNN
ncbi:MAG TPA: restriction endonuclease [Clostridium sp.]|uniref:restriction endonuclease n=1 Tax=Clostridium sp. TaxID=1506 RepID=UPI002F93844A